MLPLRQCGEVLLKGVAIGSPAHLHVQGVQSDLQDRWHIVSDQLQSARGDVSCILTGWKGYIGVKEGLVGFLEGMVKVVGSEAAASYEGDLSQLAEYKVWFLNGLSVCFCVWWYLCMCICACVWCVTCHISQHTNTHIHEHAHT